MKKFEDRYIGDGVYASTDGFGIALDLRAQEPTPTNRIYLEPPVFEALLKYAKDARAHFESQREAS